MTWISKAQILSLHAELISQTGGTPGLRDEGLLDSALHAPLQTFDGVPLYPTVLEKCVRLSFLLSSNHAFVDGNKRIGALALLVVLDLNGLPLRPLHPGELSDLFLSVASKQTAYEDLLAWVRSRIHRRDCYDDL